MPKKLAFGTPPTVHPTAAEAAVRRQLDALHGGDVQSVDPELVNSFLPAGFTEDLRVGRALGLDAETKQVYAAALLAAVNVDASANVTGPAAAAARPARTIVPALPQRHSTLLCVPGNVELSTDGTLQVADAAGEPQHVALVRAVVAALTDEARLAALLQQDGQPSARMAAGFLAGELLRLRAQLAPLGQGSTSFSARAAREALRRALVALLAAGVEGTDVVVSLPRGGRPAKTVLLMLATCYHDVEALAAMWRERGCDAQAATPDRLPQACAAGVPSAAGTTLGASLLTAGRTKASAGQVAQAWDEHLLRTPASAPADERAYRRALFAQACLQQRYAEPAHELLDRLLQCPLEEAGDALTLLFDAFLVGAHAGQAERMARHGDFLVHEPRQCEGLPGPWMQSTPLHRLAAMPTLSEALAARLVAIGRDNDVDFRQLANAVPNEELDMRKMTLAVPACVVAALAGRGELATMLLAEERRCQSRNFEADQAGLLALAQSMRAQAEEAATASLRDLATSSAAAYDTADAMLRRVAMGDEVDADGASDMGGALRQLAWLGRQLATKVERARRGRHAPVGTCTEVSRRALSLLASEMQQDEAPALGNTVAQARERCAATYTEMATQAVRLHGLRQQRARERAQLRNPARAILPGRLQGRLDTYTGRLQHLAALDRPDGMQLLLANDAAPEPFDVAEAYALGVMLRSEPGGASGGSGTDVAGVLERHCRDAGTLWGLFYAALELGDVKQVAKVAKVGADAGVVLDDLEGSYAPYVVQAAARTSAVALRAVLSRVHDPAARARLCAAQDATGDNVYHVAARGEGKVLHELTRGPGFVPSALTEVQNAAGLTALQEVVWRGAKEATRLLWQNRDAWNLRVLLVEAMRAAALEGNVAGVAELFVQAGATDEVRATVAEVRRGLDPASAPAATLRALEAQWRATRTSPGAAQISAAQMADVLGAGQRAAPAAASDQIAAEAPTAQQAAATRVRLQNTPSKLHAALDAFDAAQRQLAPEAWRGPANVALCAQVIYDLEQRFFGRYFGAHFFAHRASVNDAVLQRRLVQFGKYGSSRFGPQDAPGILRARAEALARAKRHFARGKNRRAAADAGLYAVQVTVPGMCGSGFVRPDRAADPVPYAGSETVRVIVRLAQGAPEVVSMYPVPSEDGRVHAAGALLPIAA